MRPMTDAEVERVEEWLVGHYGRYAAGSDPEFMGRYRRRVRAVARHRGWTADDVMETIAGIFACPPAPGAG